MHAHKVEWSGGPSRRSAEKNVESDVGSPNVIHLSLAGEGGIASTLVHGLGPGPGQES